MSTLLDCAHFDLQYAIAVRKASSHMSCRHIEVGQVRGKVDSLQNDRRKYHLVCTISHEKLARQ